MKPGALIQSLRKGGRPAAGYLLLGSEPFYRKRCRASIRQAVLGEHGDETAVVEIDLKDQPLTALVEEARTLSLFSTERLVIGRNAEHALPRDGGQASQAAKLLLQGYFSDPVPGTVLLLEATRYDSQERDERDKLARVGKFYESVPVCVDLQRLTVEEAQFVAEVLARRVKVSIAQEVLIELVEMLGADGFRIENELEKLASYAGEGGEVTRADLEALVPEARQSGVFEFSEALANRDRSRALALLDNMSRAGMYWPMQINLIAGLFRQALAARELGLRDARQIASKLGKFGLRVWPSRARQLEGIVARFASEELRAALIALFEADRGLRSSRPDDRVVVELLVMKLTS